MMQRQGGLSVETMCELAGVARSSFYRYLRTQGLPLRDDEQFEVEPGSEQAQAGS